MSKPLALIIEDDEDLSFIFSTALSQANFEVEIIHDGGEALERLRAVVPDLVTLDLHLPEVAGKQLLHFIRGDKRLEQTLVIITTADSLMAQTLNNQADMVLLKPVSFDQLRDLSEKVYEKRARFIAKRKKF